MPIWTFQGPSTELVSLDQPYHEFVMPTPVNDLLHFSELPLEDAFSELALNVISLAPEKYGGYMNANPLKFLIALKVAKHWGVLYQALKQSPKMKKCCCRILSAQILEAKNLLRQGPGVPEIESIDEGEDMNEEEDVPVIQTKPWPIRLAKKYVKIRKQGEAPEEVEECHVIEIPYEGVFGATNDLIQVRKSLNVKYKNAPFCHMTVLNWETCSVFALNQKDRRGVGTTRIATPYVGETETNLRVRVLDLTYKEIAQGIQVMKESHNLTDSDIAKIIIDLVKGSPIDRAMCSKTIALTKIKSHFLYGVRLDQETMTFDKDWWVSNKNTKINPKVRMDQFLCSVISILFIAEPRHARAMMPITLLQLQEVTINQLSFNDLFCDLEKGIEYGTLLAGYNFVGNKLKLQDAIDTGDWLKTQFAWNIVSLRVLPNQTMQSVQPCKLKDLRMVLGDSPAYHDEPNVPCHGATLAITNSQKAGCPEYQVLMKEFFTILLGSLTRCIIRDQIKQEELPVFTLVQHAQAEIQDDDDDDIVLWDYQKMAESFF